MWSALSEFPDTVGGSTVESVCAGDGVATMREFADYIADITLSAKKITGVVEITVIR